MFFDSNQFVSTFGRLTAAALLAVLGTTSAIAQDASVSLDLNDDAVRLSFQQIRPARQISFEGSAFNHQDRGTVLAAGFHITGNAATKARPINAGLGGRLIYADVDDDFLPGDTALFEGLSSRSGYGLAVGGFFKGQVPNYDRIGFGGHVYFAPDVLAFGDLQQFTDAWLYGSYSVLRNGDVYLGARILKGDFDQLGDHNFDTGLHVGFTLKF